jgi:chemosensory pili system protein ChpA (sensor histidine kinase/response regulator)
MPAPAETPAAAQPAPAPADDIDALFDDPFSDPFDDAYSAPELTQAAPPPAEPLTEPIEFAEPVESAEPALASVPVSVAEEPDAEAAVPAEVTIADELDPDLLPVFIEEANDLLPEIGNGLRAWQAAPGDSAQAQMLQRALHTVKGSARMAGAMRLGQHAHDIETQIENMVHAGTSTPAAFDELIANYDQALAMFEQLQRPAGAEIPAGAEPPLAPAPAAEEAPGQQRAPLVRVRADILDRLVNQAGEVSITRSKLESQVASLKTSLADFSDNLARLRRQLREVEMQAESQIASTMSIAGEQKFDPLEFDRFTRLQELTRMMAESVNDVASFHESLGRTVDSAAADLSTQSRLTRDLQRDLMRVRMVPFASLSERLFRVARQTAKEVDKRVNLDIRGGAVEIDRSVLEQMAAPFEHLLRNAIVHGIEARAARTASSKAETGELLIQASQQGNEVVIEFSDDGAGLDLERIRAKGAASGLIADGQELSDAEAAELIFEPGFSTAEALTELAGRGVGMDVVRSQAQALGGRIAIATTPGRGARFTIHLPLTLAVTQVVLTVSGGRTYAMPSVLVEQVLQIKEADAQAARAAGAVSFQGQQVALHYLPGLLGEADVHPLAQRSCPVLILRSGNERVAVQVDDVQGNREVVIKNVGPQLSRMIGIAGATVLGSGDIVLILNPVALAQHVDSHPELRAQVGSAVGSAVGSNEAQPAALAPARDYVVMVVDDSLTVRKVTQRLLEREGYRVVLAKDGVDALERLQETLPDLMLVDIEMPRMDGFDLTRNIRGNDSSRAIPVIMITSRTADKHRNYAMDLGVNAYFGKPFQEDVLLAAIAGLLKRELAV